MRRYSIKEKVGCLVLDLPRLMSSLFLTGKWIGARNRNDELKIESGGVQTDSLGPWSSDIHACHVFPWIGRQLMSQALSQWPISFINRRDGGKPAVSFIIPHRGKDRLPLLHKVVRSILAQNDVAVQCVVVEQSSQREVDSLPEGVRYIHLPHPTDAVGWRKAWAFNVGVEAAVADIVVCHDGDILVPAGYATEVLRHIEGGCEVAHLQRFLFCIGERDTRNFLETGRLFAFTPERVRQNWQGGTVAIRKEAFERIGGYDERFVGWGGEDNEFYDRCRTLKRWHFGYLPFVHLWHDSRPEKVLPGRDANHRQLVSLLERPAKERIAALKACGLGYGKCAR